ncbi:MAG: KdsC family phosphatase, partial [Clostridium neonatale]
VKKRAEKLKIDELHMGIKNKLLTVRLICEKYKISLENVAYIGDDINDLDVIRNVGIGCSVNDAMECIKSESNYVTKVNGGEGAVREIAELILKNRK